MLVPAPDQSGTTTITITVADVEGASVQRQFLVTISSPNNPPTLSAPSNLAVFEDAAPQTAHLTGITSGGLNESQALTVTALSGSPGLIPHPAVNYTSPNSTGTLSFRPSPNAYGEAIISVTVRDNGGSGNGGIDAVSK
jgi:hypothetical protein